MLRSIMVPLDGSAFGEHALPLALGIARRAGIAAHLVHACEPPRPSSFRNQPAGMAPEAERQRGRAYLASLADCLTDRWDVQIKTAIVDGPAETALRHYALEHKCDLVVLSTHGYGPLSRMWLGSVARALALTLPMPLLLTRPHGEPVDLLESVTQQPFQRVLVPLDGSPLAEQALEPALALGQLVGAEYTLLQVIEPPALGYAPAAYVAGLDQHVLDQWRAIAEEYLGGVAERLHNQAVRCTSAVVFGPTAGVINDYARSHAFDLIAMATHGRSGAARMLLGSIADRVVQTASVPVLLYRHPDHKG